MNEIKLSYVITTRNKLPYLKQVMKRLLANVQEDEEILVADAASTDGTVEYLTDLYRQGKINQFISEPDRGEAHGYNKCFLMARGELIKVITDDDAFYYPAIKECKKFMLEHEEVDVIGGDQAGVNLANLNQFRCNHKWLTQFKKWFNNKKVTYFSGLGLIIRRKSLALTGLFATDFVTVDIEYSMRITYLNKVNIAWNNAILVTRIDNPQSNSRKMRKTIKQERKRLWLFYGDEKQKKDSKLKVVESLKKSLRPIKKRIEKILNYSEIKNNSKNTLKTEQENSVDKIVKDILNKIDDNVDNTDLESSIENAFNFCDEFMQEYNNINSSTILYKIENSKT
jgi:glycosyltransferase involved in cell wall biosynthesis